MWSQRVRHDWVTNTFIFRYWGIVFSLLISSYNFWNSPLLKLSWIFLTWVWFLYDLDWHRFCGDRGICLGRPPAAWILILPNCTFSVDLRCWWLQPRWRITVPFWTGHLTVDYLLGRQPWSWVGFSQLCPCPVLTSFPSLLTQCWSISMPNSRSNTCPGDNRSLLVCKPHETDFLSGPAPYG